MKLLISIFLSVIVLIACKATRSGRHASHIKKEELNEKSDFDLKQANVIIDHSEKHKESRKKKSKKYQKKVAEELNEMNKNKKDKDKNKKNSGSFEFY